MHVDEIIKRTNPAYLILSLVTLFVYIFNKLFDYERTRRKAQNVHRKGAKESPERPERSY